MTKENQDEEIEMSAPGSLEDAYEVISENHCCSDPVCGTSVVQAAMKHAIEEDPAISASEFTALLLAAAGSFPGARIAATYSAEILAGLKDRYNGRKN